MAADGLICLEGHFGDAEGGWSLGCKEGGGGMTGVGGVAGVEGN